MRGQAESDRLHIETADREKIELSRRYVSLPPSLPPSLSSLSIYLYLYLYLSLYSPTTTLTLPRTPPPLLPLTTPTTTRYEEEVARGQGLDRQLTCLQTDSAVVSDMKMKAEGQCELLEGRLADAERSAVVSGKAEERLMELR